MWEELAFDSLTPIEAALIAGLVLGALYGAIAQVSGFCLRRGLVSGPDRGAALGTWLSALFVAILGTQALGLTTEISFEETRFASADLPLLALILGGLCFGAGMVLTRGCVSRLTVLAGSGNLRALLVLLAFAIIAHSVMKGALAPLRVAVSDYSVDAGFAHLTALPGGVQVWTAISLAAIALLIWRARPSLWGMLAGGAIGGIVVLGWWVNGWLLLDMFDPLPLQSLAFTASASESLFWAIAGTAVNPGFGVGLFGGVIAGAALMAGLRGRFEVVSFESPAQTGRYLLGAGLMGFGGVTAGGCTVGAGLSGGSLLSLAALITLGSIVLGARGMAFVLEGRSPATLARA